MNDVLSVLLLSVPGLPLLLAFPMLRSRLPWARYLALLPAVIVAAVPATYSVELPWLLFGSELGIDGASRLLLVMSVVLWATAATLLRVPKGQADYLSTFFLLTLAGNLGAILSIDLVVFFAFSTLMGYGFYGLLVAAGDEGTRRAARVYLVLMILADLALFEVLLVVAVTTENLGFEAMHHAMAQSPSLGLYLSLVLFGFAVKAGIWPFHFWLALAFGSARLAVALLLCGVPVAIALLGMLRWLPLGEISSPELGLIIQGIGVAAVLYAILAGLKKAQRKMLPVHATILATGLFLTAIGAGLADSAAWNRYGNWVHYFIALLGFGLAVLVTASSSLVAKQADDSSLWFERWSGTVVVWAGKTGFDTLPRWRAWWLAKLSRLWLVICAWQSVLDASERTLQGWTLAITLFLLLGIVVVFVGALS